MKQFRRELEHRRATGTQAAESPGRRAVVHRSAPLMRLALDKPETQSARPLLQK